MHLNATIFVRISRDNCFISPYTWWYIYIRYTTKDGSVDKKNYFSFFFLCLRIRQLVNSVWEIISPFFHFWKFQRSESKINFTIRIKTGNLYIYIYFFFDSTILNVSLNFSTVFPFIIPHREFFHRAISLIKETFYDHLALLFIICI